MVARAAGLDSGRVERRYRPVLHDRIFGVAVLSRTRQRRELGRRGAAASGRGSRRSTLGVACRGRLGRQACPCLDRPGSVPPHCSAYDATTSVKGFDKHKICGTIISTATKRKEVIQWLEGY